MPTKHSLLTFQVDIIYLRACTASSGAPAQEILNSKEAINRAGLANSSSKRFGQPRAS